MDADRDRGTLPCSAGTVVFFDTTQDLILAVRSGKHRGWSLPFGKVEPGETLLEAALRETREETRVEVEPLLHVPVYVDHLPRSLAFAFVARRVGQGIPQSSEEGEADFVPCAWVESGGPTDGPGVYADYNRRAIASARRALQGMSR